ncbi:hypothetical protein BKI52_27360 [marine bacterium AO1-C]|nr:hypothetical protein BKI52_27360 [marine bacterium AO1-C]
MLFYFTNYMDFIRNLEQLKQEIENHDLLEIVSFEIAPPASEATIIEIEQKCQITLDKELKEFYRQMNGCHLHWQLKPLTEDEYDEKVYDKFGDYEPDLEDDDENPFAQIKINSLEVCFLEDWFDYSESYDNTIVFKGQEYVEHQFSKKVKILDSFSVFSCIAYVIDKEVEDSPLMMLSGHYADWYNSRLLNFNNYWQILMKSKGINEIKDDIFGEADGYKQPPILNLDDFGENLSPKLFEK